MNREYELGFIGAGNMAEAMARAAIEKGVLAPGRIIAADPSDARREAFGLLNVEVVHGNDEVLRRASQVVLAVKPQMIGRVAPDLSAHLGQDQVVISIMAGITTARLGKLIGKPARIVRVMPNTPLLVGMGMSALCLGGDARPGDETLAHRLLEAAGRVVTVEESKMDAVTAVSGSGPAYLFYLAEAMEKAAQALGLGPDSPLLVRQTLLGAASLLAQAPTERDDSGTAEPIGPAELRRRVTSPGGTTEAAIKHLDGNKSFEVIVNALKAAEKRSRELGA